MKIWKIIQKKTNINMQRMNRNRMGPSFPKAPPARLPMMDFRAKPGFEQKYNILPDISGARKTMENDDVQYYQHDEQFTQSWQSPSYSMGNSMHIGGHRNIMQNNGYETGMALNREPRHLIDGFYNEPNNFNPGIQRTLTHNHKILPRPSDPFPTKKNDELFNAAPQDRTFISGNVRDQSLYGTKKILPGISKKDKTNVQSNHNRESGGFMKRVQSSHALNVHLPKEKSPFIAIGSKEGVETLDDHTSHSEEKQGHINIVPERFAEIMKEEIQRCDVKENECVVPRDVRPCDNESKIDVVGQFERDSTECTSIVDDGKAYSENKYGSIQIDRREKLGMDGSDSSNKSFSYEATENEEILAKENVDDGYADTIRRGSHSDILTAQPSLSINHKVEVQFEICDDEKSASFDNLNSIRRDRNEKLGIESSNESNKSLSYEETENTEDKLKHEDGDFNVCYGIRDSNPEIITVRRDSMTCVNHDVDIEYDTSDDEKQENGGNLDDSIKVDRREKLGIESSDESNQSCSYETSYGDEIGSQEMENNSYSGYNKQISSPEIITIRRDGMKCVNYEVEIEYDDDETESEDIPKYDEGGRVDSCVSNTIEMHEESVNTRNTYVPLNETKSVSDQNDFQEESLSDDSSKDVVRREKLKFEGKNGSNRSFSYETSENEEIGVDQEDRGPSYQNAELYPEIMTVRRDGMMCVNHEVDIEYEEDEDESCTTESDGIHQDNNDEKQFFLDIPVETIKGLDNEEHLDRRFVQNESKVDLEQTACLAEVVIENVTERNRNEDKEGETLCTETDRRDIIHFAQQESNKNLESGSKKNKQIENIGLDAEKHNACRIEAKFKRDHGDDKVDNDSEVSLNITDKYCDASSNMSISAEKTPKDANTSISQRRRVIAVEPESVKREHRKRKRERDKIRKSTTRLNLRKNSSSISSSSTDSKPRAIEAKTLEITYETDDDIDNISDKILDQNSEAYSKGLTETSKSHSQLKSTKKVRFDDEPRVYNFLSINSNSTENTNAEDSIADDTAYDTDEDIDKISNDILDEVNDEKQFISKQTTVDENKDKVVYEQNDDRQIVVNKGNTIRTFCELPELKTSEKPKRVPIDKLSKSCDDSGVLKEVDGMKLTISKGTCEQKRRNSNYVKSTDRKFSDLLETENEAPLVALGNQKFKRNNRGQLKRHNYGKSNIYGHIKGESIIQKNIIAAGDSDVAANIKHTRTSEEGDIGIKLLTISRNGEEINNEPLLRVKTEICKENRYIQHKNDRCEIYASDIHRSELYKKIMSILETKVGLKRAASLMRSKTITEMVDNLTTNPEKYGRHFAELIKLREDRPYLDLTQYIKDPTKVDGNRSWSYYEQLQILAMSFHSTHDQDLNDSSDSAIVLPNNDAQADVNLNADDHDGLKGIGDVTYKNEQSEIRHKRRFSFKDFFRKTICVCKPKVGHDDIETF